MTRQLIIWILPVALSILPAGARSQELAPALNASKELEQLRRLLLSESDLDSIVDNVLQSSYALKMTEEEIASLQEEVSIEGRSWLRSVAIGVNLFGYNVTPSQIENPSTTQVSVLSNAAVTLLISPFDIIGQKSRVRRAQHRVAMQEMALNDKRRQAEIYVINKFLNYQAALETFIICENNLMTSEEIKQIADEEFKRGSISYTEYSQALNGQMEKRVELLKIENQVMQLKLEIELLMRP